MKTWMVAIALCSLAGLAWAAPDELEDSYNGLKAAEAKKDADGVKRLAAATSKLARAAAVAPLPAGGDAAAWKERVDYSKQVDTYTEYALGATAATPGLEPGKVVELVDQLIAQNSKSKYLGAGMPAYVGALGSLASSLSASNRDRALAYANKLVNTMKARSAPEGVAEADWEKVRAAAFGSGYYIAGVINGQKQVWKDCDTDLKEALPYINKDQSRLGVAYFYLGLCDFQFGQQLNDRAMMQAGQKYSDQSSNIPGPNQAQARQNAYAMRNQLATPAKR